MYAHLHVLSHANTHACMLTRTFTHTHTQDPTHTHTYAHSHTHAHTHVCALTRTLTRIQHRTSFYCGTHSFLGTFSFGGFGGSVRTEFVLLLWCYFLQHPMVPHAASAALLPGSVQHQGVDALQQVSIDLHMPYVTHNLQHHGVVWPIKLVALVVLDVRRPDLDALCCLSYLYRSLAFASAETSCLFCSQAENGFISQNISLFMPPLGIYNASNRTDTSIHPSKRSCKWSQLL